VDIACRDVKALTSMAFALVVFSLGLGMGGVDTAKEKK